MLCSCSGAVSDCSGGRRIDLQSVSPAVTRRLMRELSELKRNPPEGIRVVTSEENMLDVTGIIEGPGEQRRVPVTRFGVQGG